jgi:hypothetical protein
MSTDCQELHSVTPSIGTSDPDVEAYLARVKMDIEKLLADTRAGWKNQTASSERPSPHVMRARG